jgi:hypothetical protein
MTEGVKAEVNNDSDLLIIPGRMTKLLQPLEVANNWPFNVAFRQLYNQWMTTMKHDLTSSSRTKHAPLPTVCEWMLAAWRSISPGVVEKVSKLLEFLMKWMTVRIS